MIWDSAPWTTAESKSWNWRIQHNMNVDSDHTMTGSRTHWIKKGRQNQEETGLNWKTPAPTIFYATFFVSEQVLTNLSTHLNFIIQLGGGKVAHFNMNPHLYWSDMIHVFLYYVNICSPVTNPHLSGCLICSLQDNNPSWLSLNLNTISADRRLRDMTHQPPHMSNSFRLHYFLSLEHSDT